MTIKTTIEVVNMKKRYYSLIIPLLFVISLLLAGQESFSQVYIDVVPGFSTLNDAINNNTNPNAIFRLQRGSGAIYLLNGSIRNSMPLTIVAADGQGARPQLIPGLGSGGVSDIAFRLKSDLTLKGIYVTAKDEGGAYLSQIIRDQADSIRIYLYDCFLENSGQSAIRTDNKDSKIYLINTTIRSNASDYANGRGVDDRGVDMDTLYIQNCTFYNISSRCLRDGGGTLNYAFVDHNTFLNIGINLMDFGECPRLVFTNNLVINSGFIGHAKSGTGTIISIQPLSSSVYDGKKQSVEVHNNNFALDPACSSLYPDTVVALDNFNPQLKAMIDSSGFDTTTNISELVAFTSPPPSVASLVTAYWNDPLLSSSTTAVGIRVQGDFNFGYSKDTKSFTAGTNSKPLGSLVWVDTTTVGIKEMMNRPLDFTLMQNYPNPFNPETIIQYTVPYQSEVSLVVYNSLGQVVKALVNGNESSGLHTVSWNGTNEAGQKVTSGIYFYKLSAGDFSVIKKMTLLK